MQLRTWQSTSLLLLATLAAACASMASNAIWAQSEDMRGLEGEWLYVEDRTAGRASEMQQPPMSVKFTLRVENGAFVLERGNGAQRREERIALDDSVTEFATSSTINRNRGVWKDGTLVYETEIIRVSDNTRVTLIRKEFRRSPDGLHVRVVVGSPPQLDSVALYRHPNDINMPEPATARIVDLAWLGGAWIGKRGASSIEERWSPPRGGAMLGVSRTVSRDSMVGFEYLRIVEKEAGLVYVAQPGGRSPTEFVLAELGKTRAVFANPRHDFPQRIVYELSDDGSLTASIGFANGGKPRRFQFSREEN